MTNYIKSPIFYMGNKYDLLGDLFLYFPKTKDVDLFIDLFGGSAVVTANVKYNNIIYNEINGNVVELVKLFINYSSHEIISHIENRIKEFKLVAENMDVRGTWFSERKKSTAKKAYLEFRRWYNQSTKNYKDLFTLTHFSFCNLSRFNSNNDFNMPFGNRCYLKEKHAGNIHSFSKIMVGKTLQIKQMDALKYLKSIHTNLNQFIYLDPPYSNTTAIYNEKRAFGGWTIQHDQSMMSELDRLSKLKIKWALSNVFKNKGKENTHLKDWAIKMGYEIIYLDEKQYSSLGKGNAQTQEVLIVNYTPPYKQYNLFEGPRL